MLYNLHPCSAEALKRCPEGFDPNIGDRVPLPDTDDGYTRRVYPFHRMQVGHCFIVAFSPDRPEEPRYTKLERQKQLATLRNSAWKATQRYKQERKFVVIKHAEHKIFEVARIA